jgi:hypothetical protein
MLFDLRGRGRRRVVKVVYVGFAVLIGVGLIGFGVGGGLGGGGLLTAATSNEGGSSASFASQIKKYRKITTTQPNNQAAWEKLAKALLHEAGGEAYTTTTGAITSKGKALFRQASEAWTSYLALNPAKPSSELAQLIFGIYGEAGLNEPAKAVQALQLVVAARPESAAYYSQLALYAYKSKNPRVGDLASGKAVELAPATSRAKVKKELEEVKKYPNGGQTYTTTTNGKTYELKKTPNGQFSGTEIKKPTTTSTTTTPSKTSTTTTTKK